MAGNNNNYSCVKLPELSSNSSCGCTCRSYNRILNVSPPTLPDFNIAKWMNWTCKSATPHCGPDDETTTLEATTLATEIITLEATANATEIITLEATTTLEPNNTLNETAPCNRDTCRTDCLLLYLHFLLLIFLIAAILFKMWSYYQHQKNPKSRTGSNESESSPDMGESKIALSEQEMLQFDHKKPPNWNDSEDWYDPMEESPQTSLGVIAGNKEGEPRGSDCAIYPKFKVDHKERSPGKKTKNKKSKSRREEVAHVERYVKKEATV